MALLPEFFNTLLEIHTTGRLTLVKDPALCFENMVALHLLKWVSFLENTVGRDMELRYFRDIDGREVNFVVLEDRQPCMFVECKWNDAPVAGGLKYLMARFPGCEAYQITAMGRKDFMTPENIRVCPAVDFLRNLV